ncbi:MAG TPA: hypothetical protein VF223_24455 [Trebonia sp.]
MSQADIAYLRQEYIRQSTVQPWGEAAAVAVLLGFEPIAGDNRLARHADRDGIDWDDVLADKTWSTGERFLIATAAGAWNGRRTQVDISRVAYLDDAFFGTWIDIIFACRHGQVPDLGSKLPGGDHQ